MTIDWEAALRSAGLDRYELAARLRPALLALMPVFLLVFVRVPEARSIVGASIGAATACGVTYFLASLSRRLGRALEQRLGDRVGRRHSARLLTLEDPTFAFETKKRYHAYLSERGLTLSSMDEERADPALALQRARSAVDWLLIHTKPDAKKTLLFDDNVSYGFNRNLCGLRPIAIWIDVSVMIANGGLIWLALGDRMETITGAVLESVLLVVLALWVFLVTESAVEQASSAYVQRLFAQCEMHKTV